MHVRHDAAVMIRAGRLVEAAWICSRDQFVGDGFPPPDEEALRAAFFAGARFLFSHMVAQARANDDGSTLCQIRREFEQYEMITQLMNVPAAGNA